MSAAKDGGEEKEEEKEEKRKREEKKKWGINHQKDEPENERRTRMMRQGQ